MGLRQTVLVVLFASLAVTALGAVAGVVIAAEWAWKVTGSSFVLTATALTWAVVARRNPARFTLAQSVILWGSGVTAALFMLAIWEEGLNRELWIFSGLLGVGALALTTIALRTLMVPYLQAASIAALSAQSLAVVLAAFDIWGLSWGGVWPTVAALVYFSPLLGATIVMRASEATSGIAPAVRLFRLAGLTLAVAAAATWSGAYMVVLQGNTYAPIPREWSLWGTIVSTLALAFGVVNLLSMAQGPRWARLIHLAAVGSVLLEGGLVAESIWVGSINEFDTRVQSSLLVVMASSLLASVIVDRVARFKQVRSAEELTEIRIECPHCRARQAIPFGRSECTSCKLGFEVRIFQNRCFQCGYSLAGIGDAPACPECGTAFVAGSGAAAVAEAAMPRPQARPPGFAPSSSA